jgi:hypothetical protein
MSPPLHTPYDGSSKPFTIGLKPLDLAEWIEVDDDLEMYLAEKRRLYATVPDKVFVEEPDTREAQREVLDLIEAHLARHHPELLEWSKARPDHIPRRLVPRRGMIRRKTATMRTLHRS